VRSVDDHLDDYTTATASWSRPDLLIGNGASQAVWPEFAYKSLYETAALSTDDRALFDALATTNFELVLNHLRITRLVCAQMGLPVDAVEQRYAAIRTALMDAVKKVHLPWGNEPEWLLPAIAEGLAVYGHVFSTNYDLLVYWAIMRDMRDRGRRFADYFWNGALAFNSTDVSQYEQRTRVLYLHGALHLYRLPSGQVVKRRQQDTNLLDAIGTEYHGADLPFFVSEGSSRDKLSVIRSSDYLSYGLEQLATREQDIVVFGHGLDAEHDQHLLDALKKRRRIAISIRPTEEVMARKVELQRGLRDAELVFFDATTHPLGAPTLQATDDPFGW
jgi:hypothetical protein